MIKTVTIVLLASVVALLMPVAMAQTIPGEEDFTNSTKPISVNETFEVLHVDQHLIDATYGDIGPVGTTQVANIDLANDAMLYLYEQEDYLNAEQQEFFDEYFIRGFALIEKDKVLIIPDGTEEKYDAMIKQKLRGLYPDAAFELSYETPVASVSSEDVEPTIVPTASTTFTHQKTVNFSLTDDLDSLQVIDSVNVTGVSTISKVDVTITINHEDHDELNGYLEDPDGNLIRLFVRERGIDDGTYTRTLSSTDNTYLGALVGSDAQGTWKLKVGDYRSGDTGTVVSWSLSITGTSVSAPTSGDNPTSVEDGSIWDRMVDWFSDLY